MYLFNKGLCFGWTAKEYTVYTFVWRGSKPIRRHVLTVNKKLADHHFGGEFESNLRVEINTAKTLAEL